MVMVVSSKVQVEKEGNGEADGDDQNLSALHTQVLVPLGAVR